MHHQILFSTYSVRSVEIIHPIKDSFNLVQLVANIIRVEAKMKSISVVDCF